MKNIMGIEYGRGATAAIVIDGGPALAPAAVKQMYPDAEPLWPIHTMQNYVNPIDSAKISRFKKRLLRPRRLNPI